MVHNLHAIPHMFRVFVSIVCRANDGRNVVTLFRFFIFYYFYLMANPCFCCFVDEDHSWNYRDMSCFGFVFFGVWRS